MTLILGLSTPEGTFIAADSGGWRDGFEEEFPAGWKIVRNGPLLIGVSGSIWVTNAVRAASMLH
jgi:hypothetical protein